MTELANPAIGRKRFRALADYRLDLGEAVLIVLPERARVSFSVWFRKVVDDFLAVNIPNEAAFPGGEALTFQNVCVEPELYCIVLLGFRQVLRKLFRVEGK